jgi:uncharacterized protein (TIGR03663 family)
MTTTAERLRTFWGGREFDRDRVSGLAERYWEVALYGALISIALTLRLWNLGTRAIHHDESLHMYYAWQLFKGDGYVHVPFMHGPFKFFSTALVFRLFGDTNFTARLVFALAGSAVVGMPYFLRGFLGRIGALAAALLLALSPTLLYVSRFNRDDILIVAYTLAMVIVMWRYLKEQKEAYLFAVPLILMLGFTTMEMTFITTAIFLVFLDYLLANDLLAQLRASRELSREETLVAFVVLLIAASPIAMLWPLIEKPRERWGLKTMPASAHFMLALLVFSLPQFAAAVQKLPLVHMGTSNIYDEGTSHQQLRIVTTSIFLVASLYIGLLWNWRIFAIGAAIFYVPYVLFYTTFFTHPGGFWTGIWGSLDYWMSQQSVRRGSQPDYYYFMFLPVYELLPLLFAVGGALYYAFRGKTEQKLQAAATVLLVFMFSVIPKHSAGPIGTYHVHAAFLIAIASILFMEIENFTKFLLFWTLSVFFALSIAGEKMPWLIIHVALPLSLLAAKVIDDILSSIGEKTPSARAAATERPRPASAKATETQTGESALWERIWPLAAGAALAIIAATIFQAKGPISGLGAVAWLLSAGAAVLVAWTARSVSWKLAGQVAAVALFGALFVFTVRSATIASFDQGDPNDYPREMLIYAQGSPALGVLDADIEKYAQQSGLGHSLPIAIDQSTNIWPWPWYMRDFTSYRGIDFSTQTDFQPKPGEVVLITSSNQSKMTPYLGDYQQGIPYTHMWWFPELYKGLKTSTFLSDISNGHTISVWRNYFIDRDVAGASSGADMIAYFPKSFTPKVPPGPTTNGTGPQASADTLPADSVTFIGDAPPGQFSEPNDVATDAQGNLYVADTLNQRIVKVAPDGTMTNFGQSGQDDGQFANPKSKDYNVSDGPWGVAVDGEGSIYVADTWNNRIQKFGPDFKFIKSWGARDLFGPRDIAIDSQGNVWVVDTGHKHVREYSANGDPINDFGTTKQDSNHQFVASDSPGEFSEPSSIYIAQNGDIYVADYWNKRIQHFDPAFKYRNEIKVKSWGSPGVTDRAYIVVLNDGHVLATDPANARVIVFDTNGEQVAAWRLPSAVGSSRPVGIAVDAQQQYAYISDSSLGANHIAKVAVAALLAAPAAGTTPGAATAGASTP